MTRGDICNVIEAAQLELEKIVLSINTLSMDQIAQKLYDAANLVTAIYVAVEESPEP